MRVCFGVLFCFRSLVLDLASWFFVLFGAFGCWARLRFWPFWCVSRDRSHMAALFSEYWESYYFAYLGLFPYKLDSDFILLWNRRYTCHMPSVCQYKSTVHELDDLYFLILLTQHSDRGVLLWQ